MHDDLDDAAIVRVCIDGEMVDARGSMTVVAAMVSAGKMYSGRSVNGARRFALCGMGVCQECRINLDGREHSLACQVYCRSGMVISTDGAWTT